MTQRVPFFRPDIGRGEIDGTRSVLESGWLTTGEQVRQFQDEFAEYVQADYAVALNSCTAALHLALIGLGVGPGDEVLVPTMTFAATSEVVLAVGASPVFVDCDPRTLKIDLVDARGKATPATKAIMPMHYGGSAVDMDAVHALATECGLVVIEDAAHAVPTKFNGRPIGGLSDATCFSFYANKTLSTGEGGMLTTNDGDLADRVRQLSLHGLTSNAWGRFKPGGAWEYDIAVPGWKYNLTDIAAAIGREQLRKCDEMAMKRRAIYQQYQERFAADDRLELLAIGDLDEFSAHLAVIHLNVDALSETRNSFIERVNAAGIGTSVHYKPLHLHSLYRGDDMAAPERLPNATAAFERIVSLPIFPTMTSDDVGHVVTAVTRTLDEFS